MTRSYDLIIAGGGAAGLSLACHLVNSPLRDRKILVVEQDAKDQDDHIWSFWTDGPMLFDAIISHSWNQLQVVGPHFVKTLDLHRYHYNMIRGSDFYRFAYQTCRYGGEEATRNQSASLVSPRVDFLRGRVERIEDGEQDASVLVDGQRYTGRWVFDSLFNWTTFHPDQAPVYQQKRDHYHYLKQQFKGWEIETPQNAFNPQVMTFWDFRTLQEQGAHFIYMLPFSERQALVESVLWTTTPVSWEACEQAVDTYLEDVLDIATYQIRRKEQGIIPLTDWPFLRRRGRHVMTIGIQGGRVKPSTGYAFLRIQQDSSAIVSSLLQVDHPFRVPASPRRYRFFDSVMLEIMTHHMERVEPIFTALFRHNSVEQIFRFLDEVASPWEIGLMLPSLPPQLLWQSLLQIGAVGKV